MKIRKIYTLTVALLSFSAFILVPSDSFAEYKGKTSSEEPKDLGRVIVKFKKDLPKKDKEALMSRHNLKKNSSIPALDVEIFDVSTDDTGREVADRLNVEKAKGKGQIEYAEPDMEVFPTFIPNDPSYSSQWHHKNINSAAAWDLKIGTGVVIAIVDTGVDCTHPDLKCVAGWNSASGNSDTTDIYGHGTKVAGSAAEVGNNTIGGLGVAFNAQIMPIRASNDATYGTASTSALSNGVIYAADHGAKVANVSYGLLKSGNVSGTYENAVNYAAGKKTVVITAAGNNVGYLSSPSTVVWFAGATDSANNLASFSAYGDFKHVAAPGVGIYTTTRGGGYASVSGTSFSAPITAGLIGLIKSVGDFTPDQIWTTICSTAFDLGDPGWDQKYGCGLIQADKAVQAAMNITGDAISPTAPSNLQASVSTNDVSLTWVASTDNVGVAGYDIYRDSVKIATVPSTAYTDKQVTGGKHEYTTYASDAAGNISPPSTPSAIADVPITFAISSGPSVTNKTTTSATIAVSFTLAGTVKVSWGTSTSLGNETTDGLVAIDHLVKLLSLAANTIYYYKVTGYGPNGEVVVSATSSFRTSKGNKGKNQ